MFSNSLLGYTSISQWLLFIGIGLCIFGLIEKKERIVLAGQIALLALGVWAAWILLTNQIAVPETTGSTMPKEARVVAYFRGVLLFSAVTVVSLLLQIFRLRFQKVSIYILLFFAMMLFFMVFNIQQMAN